MLTLMSNGKVEISTSESCIANLIYLSSEINKIPNAINKISNLIKANSIICCGKKGILEALDSDFKDKEDAIQYYTAVYNDIDYFVTRNVKDYKNALASLPVVTPQQLIELLFSNK